MYEFGKERVLRGTGIAPGRAYGLTCMLDESRHADIPDKKEVLSVDEEIKRLEDAVHKVSEALRADYRKAVEVVGEPEAAIFNAQAAVVEDPVLQTRIRNIIRERAVPAEAAVAAVLDEYQQKLGALEDQYLKDRSNDIYEIKQRLLDALRDIEGDVVLQCGGGCRQGKSRIIVARRLLTGVAAVVARGETLGMVSETGGPTSHAALIARAVGIPAVSGIEGIYDNLTCSIPLLVDGDRGEVVLWPSKETIRKAFPSGSVVAEPPSLPRSSPIDGYRVMANINIASEAVKILGAAAEGVGLYRTEYEFIAAGRLLGEEEQFTRYRSVVEAMNGLPVYIRLLDVDEDKVPPGVKYEGSRGGRFLLKHRRLFETQARAIARAAQYGPVGVLYPMVTDVDEFLELKEAFEKASGGGTTHLRHGVMFEVPSLCLRAKEIFEEADFGSIGTNDLVELLFGMGREDVTDLGRFARSHSLLWDIVGGIVDAAKASGKDVSICGGIAEEPSLVGDLLNVGLRSFSVGGASIVRLRRNIAEHIKKGVVHER